MGPDYLYILYLQTSQVQTKVLRWVDFCPHRQSYGPEMIMNGSQIQYSNRRCSTEHLDQSEPELVVHSEFTYMWI